MAFITIPSTAHNARAVTPNELEELASPGYMDGLIGTPALAAIAAASGGMDVQIPADRTLSLGGHLVSTGPTPVTVTATSNASGSTRLDLLVARLTRSTGLVTPVLIAGTPGGPLPSPTFDDFGTGTRDLPLAKVTVLSGASSVTVTPVAWYIGADGATALAPNSECYPPHGFGRRVVDWALGRVSVSTGTTWKVDYEDTGYAGITFVSGWAADAFANAMYRRINGVVYMTLGAKRTGADVPPGSNPVLTTLPAGFWPAHTIRLQGVLNGGASPPYPNIIGRISHLDGTVAFTEFSQAIGQNRWIYCNVPPYPAA